LLPLFNEIQQKWIEGFLRDDYSYEELVAKLLDKENQKVTQLQAILNYVHTNACRRDFIQDYFSDEIVKTQPEICCDNDGLVIEKFIQSFPKNESNKITQPKNWQEVMNVLF
jgi:ATP-dependent DNA helicase RecQ